MSPPGERLGGGILGGGMWELGSEPAEWETRGESRAAGSSGRRSGYHPAATLQSYLAHKNPPPLEPLAAGAGLCLPLPRIMR